MFTETMLDETGEKQMASWERINYEEFSRKKQTIEEESVLHKVRLPSQ